MSLATKYRPTTFDDVIGQETIIESLKASDIKQSYLFVGGSGQGKAQPLYSKLLTPNGYINMGDVKIGDEVFGEDGKPHKVIGVYPQGKKPVYELTFSDGSKCRCSDEHLWYISDNCKKSWKVVELKEFKDKPLKKIGSRYKYQIPITHPIEFLNTKLPIDPWLMGVLLGDGGFTNNNISVTLYEEDIFNRVKSIIEAENFELNLFSKNKPKIKSYRIRDILFNKDTSSLSRKNGTFGNRMIQKIYNLGLLNHKSEDKFIPKCFLYNSIENRIKLLQGLFDTDGTLNISCGKNNTKSCSIAYTTSSKQLAEDIVFLVQSLGGTCTCNEHETFYTYKGERKQGLNNFELYIKIPNNIKIFTSKKHNERWATPQLEPYRTIRNIEYIGEEECQCIMVDNLSHLYLTDNMIVTHNTTTSRILANKINGQTIEMDAASNNSAEAMRNLIDSVKQRPLSYDYTVVIIDECGNLSKIAWDTLLKVIEEPPRHLIFILCTTEVDKIPKTIYNRCTVYEFTSIPVDKIKNRLEEICKKENFKYEDNALWVISHRADGSMRQAISYLEQCSYKDITLDNVKSILIADSFDTYLNLFYAVVDNNIKDIKTIINKVSNIDKFTEQFFCFILDMNIYIKTNSMELTSIPYVYKTDFDNFSILDKQFAEILTEELLTLQYEGRNSPILKYLLIAVLMKVSNKEVVPF